MFDIPREVFGGGFGSCAICCRGGKGCRRKDRGRAVGCGYGHLEGCRVG